METLAVVFENPQSVDLRRVAMVAPSAADIVVDVEYTGISSGTERLLWNGKMPAFPGMGYPLVPGYESVGRVRLAGRDSGRAIGDRVFVAGARCFDGTRALFGGAAATLIVPGDKATLVDEHLDDRAVLLSLAATAHHAMVGGGDRMPQLIVGHGVLGRLLARLTLALGGNPPVVWETSAPRRDGADGYRVCDPLEDSNKTYDAIYDVSGDGSLLDTLIACLAPRGEIVLAGFYDVLAFRFPPAFMREARFRVAAEFTRDDLLAVTALANAGTLALDGLITHRCAAENAAVAYPIAFTDASCLKMILDWRTCA